LLAVILRDRRMTIVRGFLDHSVGGAFFAVLRSSYRQESGIVIFLNLSISGDNNNAKINSYTIKKLNSGIKV